MMLATNPLSLPPALYWGLAWVRWPLPAAKSKPKTVEVKGFIVFWVFLLVEEVQRMFSLVR